jgi:exodeoxyribonuclease X
VAVPELNFYRTSGFKHRGRPWAEPPDDYLRWMVGQGGSGQGDMDADVVAAARQELDRRVTALAGASDAG